MVFFEARKEFILFAAAVTGATLISIMTMQILVGALILIGALLLLLAWYHFREKKPDSAAEQAEGEAVLAAGLITLVAAANMQWIIWVVALAFIFMIHQSLSRIEKHIAQLESRAPPRE